MAYDVNHDDDTPSTSSTTSDGSWWGSWKQGWIDTVKEKSVQTIQMVKNDLNEFVEVIQGDTSVVLSDTAIKIEDDNDGEEDHQTTTSNFDSIESATKVVKKGMANFLHSVSELMAIPPDDSSMEEIITIPDLSSPSSHYDRKEEKLHAIQIDPKTYCEEPDKLFSEWIKEFHLHDNKQLMSSILVDNPSVRSIYTQLVPAVVSHTMFWQRYFYQVFLLEEEERKREEIVARATINESNDGDEVGSGWDDDDDDNDYDGIEVVLKCDMDYSMITNSMVNDGGITGGIQCEEDENTISNKSNNEGNVDIQNIEIQHENIHKEETDNSVSQENLSEKQTIDLSDKDIESNNNISSDIIDTCFSAEMESDNETIQPNSTELETHNQKPVSPVSAHGHLVSQGCSETSSLSSWMSIDDVIKVKKIKEDQEAKGDPNVSSANVSTDSNGVLINKSDIIDESDEEDFDIDLDDVNEIEVAKMVEEIKNRSVGGGNLGDDDDEDWENWE